MYLPGTLKVYSKLVSGCMKPESNDFAPGGNRTSPGFCTESASVVTSCSVFAVFFHTTVVPTGIVSFAGTYSGGLSVIVTVTTLSAARAAGAITIAATVISAATTVIAKRQKW